MNISLCRIIEFYAEYITELLSNSLYGNLTISSACLLQKLVHGLLPLGESNPRTHSACTMCAPLCIPYGDTLAFRVRFP